MTIGPAKGPHVMTGVDRPPEAERAASSGLCEQCRQPYQGRRDKRFCRDACRTRCGRERKARALQEMAEALVRLTGRGAR